MPKVYSNTSCKVYLCYFPIPRMDNNGDPPVAVLYSKQNIRVGIVCYRFASDRGPLHIRELRCFRI